MQQVNLLNNIPVKKEYYSSLHFFMVCLGVCLFLCLISFYKVIRYSITYAEYVEMKSKREQAMKSLEKVATQYPIISREKNLVKSVSELNKQLNKRVNVYKTLTKAELTTGFSSYLQALSSYVPSTVSLSHIYISQQAGNVVLMGKAMQGVTVSEMVKALYKDNRFKTSRFQEYDIREEPDGVSFQIATKNLHYEFTKKEEENVESSEKEEAKTVSKQDSDSSQQLKGLLEKFIK